MRIADGSGLDLFSQSSFRLAFIWLSSSTPLRGALSSNTNHSYIMQIISLQKKITLSATQQTCGIQSRRFESPSPLRYRKQAQFLPRSLFLAMQWTGNKTQSIYTSLWRYMYIHTLTGHFIRYILLVPGWTPFVFRTTLILRGIDLTRCWKHSSEILVHIDMIASHSCCRFVHDENLSFHHITKVLYWIEIWWLWRTFE